MTDFRSKLRVLIFFTSILVLLFYRLGDAPLFWWDEGWTLSIAKNYLLENYFGQINDGARTNQSLSGHYPIVYSAYLGFKWFGVGIWQGRLPFVLYTILTGTLVFSLTAKWFGKTSAVAAIFALVMLIPHPTIHPIFSGRQVLGDIPAAMLFLAGSWFYHRAEKDHWAFMLPAAVIWALAIAAKAQMQYLGAAGAVLALLVLVGLRRFRSASLLFVTAAPVYPLSVGFHRAFYAAMPPRVLTQEPIEGLVNATGIVPDPVVRGRALLLVFVFALPFVISLFREGLGILRAIVKTPHEVDLPSAGVLTWAVASGFFAWYLLLSNSGDRYLSTPVVLAAPFIGRLLLDVTQGFNLRKTFRRAASATRFRKDQNGSLAALGMVVLTAILVPSTIFVLAISYKSSNQSLMDTAAFLNNETALDAKIETYDSELLIFLDRRVHYPPDQLHVDLLHRNVYGTNEPVTYDPLAASPDWLVVGPQSDAWQLYDDVVASGAFRLITEYGPYRIYERTSTP